MTPELWKTLIGAIVLVLTAVAAYIKMRTDIDKIKSERASTKAQRDSDSEQLHDQCQKNTWEIKRLQDDAEKRDAILTELRYQVNELNTNLLLVSKDLKYFGDALNNLCNQMNVSNK